MRTLAVHGLGGGFAYGVMQSGAELTGEVETEFGAKTRELNLPLRIQWHASRLSEAQLRHAKADLVFGCPPCAGFSIAGSGLEQHDNPGHKINDGIRDWFYAVDKAQPMIAVLESVPRTFLSEAGQELWRPLAGELSGYGWNVVTYNNLQLGVPQKRERTLLWAMKGGVPDVQLNTYRAPRTTSDALTDLPEPDVSWQVDEAGWGHNVRPVGANVDWIMAQVPWGGNARKVAENWDIWEELQRRGKQRPSFLWRRLHPQRPSPVLLADACERVAHYRGAADGAAGELRYLSGREVARLMGYPDEFRLAGHLRRDVGPALCQAVSPAVGRWVGVEASRLLEAGNDAYLQVHGSLAHTDLTGRPSE